MPADKTVIRADIDAMLRAVLADFGTDLDIELDSTFRDDLGMESIDVVALAGRLQARYGGAVNLAQFVATLDVDSVGTLCVGQLVEHIVTSLNTGAPAEGAFS